MRTITRENYKIPVTTEQDKVLTERDIADRDVTTLLGEPTVITAPWQGMFIVIEPDGHTHS